PYTSRSKHSLPTLHDALPISIMRYKKTDKSLPEIARELNVGGIIEGTVQRSGDRVRITAQLIEGATDKHLWAQRCLSVAPSMSCAVIRTRSPDRWTVPSMIPPTFNSRAISGRDLSVFLYRMMDVREITFTDPI